MFSGGIYIPPEILGRHEAPAPATAGTSGAAPPKAADSPRDLGLTERQIEVLALMMQGKSNKAICRVLDLAEPTVKNHVTADPEGAEGHQPHRGGHRGRGAGLGLARGDAS